MKLLRILSALAVFFATNAVLQAQILPPGATPAKLSPSNNIVGGIAINFVEGPLYDGNGGVYFTDLHAANNPVGNPSRILRYDITLGTTTVADLASGGTNGMFRDASGNIYTADRDGQAKAGQVRQISRRPSANISLIDAALATSFNGTVFNGPNDLVVDSAGGIYFTDPNYENRSAQSADGVYYLTPPDPDTQVRTLYQRLTFTLTGHRPNGVMLSPNGQTFYLALEQEKRIMAYDVGPNGTLTNAREFAKTNINTSGVVVPSITNGPDGMTIDQAGNLYAAVSNAVWAWDPAGKELFRLSFPEDPTNVELGGADGKTLFTAAGKSLYGIHLNVPTPTNGDFTGDGKVDAADYTVWQDSLGSTTFLAADSNRNNVVDTADLTIWQVNFGAVFGSGGISAPLSAPEPSSLLLLTLSSMFALRLRLRFR